MPMLLTIGGPLIVDDSNHDASASAADLISSARFELKLDNVLTEYSAQYLVDNASTEEGGVGSKITVKDCLEYALKEGIPKAEDWPPLGSLSKPPGVYKPDLVSSKGEVIEAKTMDEADDSLWDQPEIYRGPANVCGNYVGLRDRIIVGVEKINGESIAKVKLWYKHKFMVVKVAMNTKFAHATFNGVDVDFSQGMEPTFVLVEFCAPLHQLSKRDLFLNS